MLVRLIKKSNGFKALEFIFLDIIIWKFYDNKQIEKNEKHNIFVINIYL